MSKATVAAGNPMAGTIDLIVTSSSPISRDLVPALRKVKGVKEVQAKIFDQVKLVVGDKKMPVMIMGLDIQGGAASSSNFKDQFRLSASEEEIGFLVAGVKFFDGMPAILGKELHEALAKEPVFAVLGVKNLQIENKVQKKDHKPHTITSIAWIEPKEAGDWAAFGGHVVFLDLDDARTIVGLPERTARRLDIALEPGVDAKEVRAEIENVIKGQGSVRTMEEESQSLQSAMDGMRAGFSMCGVAALIVGMFLVYSSLAVSVAERRHEIGILLSLGATRDQVWRLFAGEACVLGALGAALGIPLGMGLAYLGLRPMQEAIGDIFATLNLRQIELTWELTALAFAVGIISSLVASLVPAIQAAYEKPAEAVRRVPKEPPVSHLVAHVVAV
jgi:ABC-type antimicrobial peptide transport system permease subunit